MPFPSQSTLTPVGRRAPLPEPRSGFDYERAFSRNLGWVTAEEQQLLRGRRVAIGGLGGVGGSHFLTLARMGVGKFTVADFDAFEVQNFNRQAGASVSTLGEPKTDVMERMVRDINTEAEIETFADGISVQNVDAFLEGVDVYVDGLDLFALEIRRTVFARCYELGIPAVTAAPMGMGTALLSFLPGGMSFEDYFCLEGYCPEDQVIKFVIGLSPSPLQCKYLVDRTRVDFRQQKVPSTPMGVELATGVACTNVLKLLLGRGEVVAAPRGLHFDAYRGCLRRTWRPWGNRNPLQRCMFWLVKRLLRKAGNACESAAYASAHPSAHRGERSRADLRRAQCRGSMHCLGAGETGGSSC